MSANKLTELDAMSCAGFLAIDESLVNWDDLLDAWPGKIVRVIGDPRKAIVHMAAENNAIGCVAGWISEDEA